MSALGGLVGFVGLIALVDKIENSAFPSALFAVLQGGLSIWNFDRVQNGLATGYQANLNIATG